MLQARPLYDSDPDAALFVAPVGWERLLGAVDHRFNVAVIAARGAGKTSTLRQLQRALRAKGERVAFADATGVADASEFVGIVESAMAGRPGPDDDAFPVAGGGAAGTSSVRLVQRVRALAQHPPTTLLADCAHSAHAASVLFGRLRDELWRLEHRWVVAVEDSERSILLSPPADAFFDQVVALSLRTDELLEMLRRRAPDLPEATLTRIAEGTGTPRAALQAVRDALLRPELEDPLAATLWRQKQAHELGRPHSMAMFELEALGGASASDEEFLRRLGWTRARASQVLGDLAEANLVVAADEQAPSGGRPRRVYRPAEPPPGAAPRSGATEMEGRDP